MMLVTLTETKARLRFNHDVDDDDLMLALEGASAAVMNYLKLPLDHYDDSDGQVPEDQSGTDVPAEVKNAVLYLVGMLSRDRDGMNVAAWERGYLPAPVVSMLYPLRDPTLA